MDAMGWKALWKARSRAKSFRAPDGREITPTYIEFMTAREYDEQRENEAFVTGWNAAMDMIFGIYTAGELNKPDFEILKGKRESAEEDHE